MSARRGAGAERTLEVYLDNESTEGPARVGLLHSDQNNIRFEYDEAWLKGGGAFALDPRLTLDKGVFHTNPDQSSFGVFMDSAPDRWGQKLMDKREQLAALEEKRQPRKLYAWDYLVGVQDETRMGALRFKRPGGEAFLDNHPRPAPPVSDLRQLEHVAGLVASRNALDDLDQLRQWLAVLVAPGASLGGARPKANFREDDGSLWIAKFPSRDDDRDAARWEMLVHQMAADAGLNVPPAALKRFASPFHTFCVRRFDRVGGRRCAYMSAMTALGRSDGESGSYLDILGFLQSAGGSKKAIAEDQRELFRRVVFNVAVGNRDDHLRNHGFIFADNGWRLAPAFDMNPAHEKDAHVLTLDGKSAAPSMQLVMETAGLYDLHVDEARAIIDSTCELASTWRERAVRMDLPKGDIKLTAAAFNAPRL